VLTFEDVPLSTGAHFFVADYHGFKFGTNSSLTTQWFYTDQVSPDYLPQSPSHYIATTPVVGPPTGALFEAAQSITSVTDFVFDGAWFTGLGDNIRYQLYNNGVLVHASTDSQTFSDTAPIFAHSGYTGLVDEVVILGRIGFYALDDFTYNEGTGIPEPTSLALVLLAGAAGVGATRRRAAAPGTTTAA
jgi:hypothetical protein